MAARACAVRDCRESGEAEDTDLDRNLIIVGSSARNTVRARYVQAGLPTAIITGEDSASYAWLPVDKVRSITITHGGTHCP